MKVKRTFFINFYYPGKNKDQRLLRSVRIHSILSIESDINNSEVMISSNHYPLLMQFLTVEIISSKNLHHIISLTAFHKAQIPLGKVQIQLFSLHLWANSKADWVLQP